MLQAMHKIKCWSEPKVAAVKCNKRSSGRWSTVIDLLKHRASITSKYLGAGYRDTRVQVHRYKITHLYISINLIYISTRSQGLMAHLIYLIYQLCNRGSVPADPLPESRGDLLPEGPLPLPTGNLLPRGPLPVPRRISSTWESPP